MNSIKNIEIKHPQIAIQYQTPQRVYKIFDNSDDFNNNINLYKCAYEYISEFQHCKGFLDIEFGLNSILTKDNKKIIINLLKLDLQDVYKNEYKIKLKKSDILIYDFSRKQTYEEQDYKISFHVIINGYFFKSLKDIEHLYNHLITKNEQNKFMLDVSVYKKCGFFRLPMMQKVYDDNFKLSKIKNILDYCLTNYNNESLIEIKQDYKLVSVNNNVIDLDNNEDTYEFIRDILKLLPEENYEDYQKWLNVGIIIFNLKLNEGLSLWIEFSKRSKKYKNGECESKYKTFNYGELGIGTLIYIINKSDNKIKLIQILKNRKKIIEKYKDTPETVVYKCINEIKKIFTKQDFNISNIKMDDGDINISLHDKYCDVCKMEHDGPCNTLIVSTKNATLSCNMSGLSRIVPTQQNYLININVTNNYYGSDDNNELINITRENILTDEILNDLIYNSFEITNQKIRDIFYYLYKDKYIYSDKIWYKYTGVLWKILDDINDILLDIENINNYLNKFKDYYKTNEKILKLIKKVRINIENQNFKEQVEKSCRIKHKHENFLEILDINLNLIGFNNGIYNLDTLKLNESKSNDYVSLSTLYNYIDVKSDYYIDIENFMVSIIPNNDDREYLHKLLGCCLLGKNKDQIISLFVGTGANGKSILNNLLEYGLGNYYGSIDSSVINNEKSNGNPEILNLRNYRLLTCNEPSTSRKLNTSILKKFSGNDNITGRYLFSNKSVSFKTQFQLIFSCNNIPDLDIIDGGMLRRLRILEFPNKFVDIPINDNELKKDIHLESKIKLWKEDMFLWLIDGLKKYKMDGLEMTPNMKKITKEYNTEQDIFLRFIDEYCDTSNPNFKIHLQDLYTGFIDWYTSEICNINIPQKIILKKALIKYNFIKVDRMSITTNLIRVEKIGFIGIKLK